MKLSAALLLMLAVPALDAAAQFPTDAEPVFAGEVASGSWLRIRSLRGRIEVRETSGRTATVTARRRFNVRPAGEISFEVKRDGSNVTVCAIWERTRRCDEDSYESRSGNDRDIGMVDFFVRLPRGVKLVASTGNGDVSVSNAGAEVKASSGNGEVEVRGADGPVRASSGNGDITVDRAGGPVNASSGNGNIRVTTARGPISASTGNGRIEAEMAQLSGDDDMRFDTGNGSITVGFPENLSARVEANVSYNGFQTDFPIQVPGRFSSRSIRGTIGSGSRTIRFSTGNGRVTIRKNG